MKTAGREVRRRARVLLTGGVLMLAGLGVLPAPAAEAPPFVGQGSSFPEPLINQLANDLQQSTPLAVDYTGVGSKKGRDAFLTGSSDFAVSDLPFNADEKKQAADAGITYAYAPLAAGALAFPFQLADDRLQPITDLTLSPQTIARIFTGEIVSWADPDITTDNGRPLNALPSNITVIVRSDTNGTTWALSRWIKAVAPDAWTRFTAEHHLPDELIEHWPSDTRAQSVDTPAAMMERVARPGQKNTNAIGYAATAWAKRSNLSMLSVKNAAGTFAPPLPANATKALAAGTVAEDHILTPDYQVADPDAYPLVMASYVIAPLTKAKPDIQERLATFLQFAVDHPETATGLGYAALPPPLLDGTKAVIAQLKAAAGTAGTTTSSSTTSTTAPAGTATTSTTVNPCPTVSASTSTSTTSTTAPCPTTTTTTSTGPAAVTIPAATGSSGSSPGPAQVLGDTLAQTGALAWRRKLDLGLLLAVTGEWLRRRQLAPAGRPGGHHRQ